MYGSAPKCWARVSQSVSTRKRGPKARMADHDCTTRRTSISRTIRGTASAITRQRPPKNRSPRCCKRAAEGTRRREGTLPEAGEEGGPGETDMGACPKARKEDKDNGTRRNADQA